ncbi:winged helix-turn-helix transcriptional regulator [Georgenia sp. Z1491]|uniref:winged helix-turn-helix transcriptional regulator n=1 Tax=Georgenia sp. Z1491 TaxID=3416707 RepID=UPI003CF131DD
MPIKRSYADHGDACATAHATELLGDRWTYPILRELMLGPKRFVELAEGLHGVTPAVLTTRLRTMREVGLVERVELPAPARATAYRVTDWGRELRPVLDALGRWAMRSPVRDDSGGLTPDGAVQSMLTMAPAAAPTPGVEIGLRLHDARSSTARPYDYRLSWGQTLEIVREPVPTARALVAGDSSTWVAVLYDGVPLEKMDVSGNRAEVRRLIDAFAA